MDNNTQHAGGKGANLSTLVKDTAIYGLSSIVGRFLNYLLVPLYTIKISAESGGYGVVTNVYAYTALLMVLLTFGMETTFFRFANKEGEHPQSVFTNALCVVGTLSLLFVGSILLMLHPICARLGYADHPEWVWMMALTVAIDAMQAVFYSLLRFQKRAIKFATLKLTFIALNIVANLIYFLFIGNDVTYVFSINLACAAVMSVAFIPEIRQMQWRTDGAQLRRMLSYSWPIFILGIAGILNQTVDKIIFPLVYPNATEAQVQLGIYGACVKIAMIMAMITQAFRYAYEPYVFSNSKERNSTATYAKAMKYFIIFTLLAFLVVVGYMDVLKNLIGRDYHDGLRVVPIVMAAEIMMGIYFNLSFWYKLIDRTIWGAWFSLAGCTVLICVNLIFIPRYGYMACAWGGFAGYATAMLLSYFVGQRKNPIDYPLRSIALYTLLALALFVVMTYVPTTWHIVLRLAVNTLLIATFAAYIVRTDLPLSSLPVVGKYVKKKGSQSISK